MRRFVVVGTLRGAVRGPGRRSLGAAEQWKANVQAEADEAADRAELERRARQFGKTAASRAEERARLATVRFQEERDPELMRAELELLAKPVGSESGEERDAAIAQRLLRTGMGRV